MASHIIRTLDIALRTAIPHASKSRNTGTLHGVRIAGNTVWASDRYTAIRTTFVTDQDLTDLDVTIDGAAARHLAKIKGTPTITKTDTQVTFTYVDGLTVTFARIFASRGEPSLDRLARLWKPEDDYHLAVGAGGGIGLNPAYIGRLAKVVQDFPKEPMLMRVAHKNMPVRFDFGDHTSVLVVPIRFASAHTNTASDAAADAA